MRVEITDWVAVYAALVATAGFAWQAITYWRAGRPKLVITAHPYIEYKAIRGMEQLRSLLKGRASSDDALDWSVSVDVVNAGRSKTYVRWVGVSQRDRIWPSHEVDSPRWLEPGEVWALHFERDKLPHATMTDVVTVTVTTGGGDKFYGDFRVIEFEGTGAYLPDFDWSEG